MRKLIMLTIILLSLAFSGAWSADGLVTLQSPYSPQKTLDRFEALAKQKGLNIFARIDHAAGAEKIGRELRPTELLIFGHPRGGTPFMDCAQTIGIDLPLKVLVWEDADSRVWLGYNDPLYLARRHGVADCPAAEQLSGVLQKLSAATLEH